MYDGGGPEAPENKLPQQQAKLICLFVGFLALGAILGFILITLIVFADFDAYTDFDAYALVAVGIFLVVVVTMSLLASSLLDARKTARKVRQDEEEILALKRSLDGYGEKREQ